MVPGLWGFSFSKFPVLFSKPIANLYKLWYNKNALLIRLSLHKPDRRILGMTLLYGAAFAQKHPIQRRLSIHLIKQRRYHHG